MKKNTSNTDIKELVASLRKSIFLVFVSLVTVLAVSIAWFITNSSVHSSSLKIVANEGKAYFEFATVGDYESGCYDSKYHLDKTTEVIEREGVKYHIINGNCSFRISNESNFNNINIGNEIRPGDKGVLDLYVICKTDKRDLILHPSVLLLNDDYSCINNNELSNNVSAHIMYFLEKTDDGTYDKKIDFSRDLEIDLSKMSPVYDGDIVIYKLSFYWVWPEQFHNLVFTGKTYNKNLFGSVDDEAYKQVNQEMNTPETRKYYFKETESSDIPDSKIDVNMTTSDYLLFSNCYNAVDEIIGTNVSYIEFGVELVGG